MARKKIEIKDVTNERPVVTIEKKTDIQEIKELLVSMAHNIELIQKRLSGGY